MSQFGTFFECSNSMEVILRFLIFIFLLGTVFLNSCHPVPVEYQERQGELKRQTKQSIIKRINKLQLRTMGPNCWNGALIKTGLAHSVRFVPKGEYWFWMNSPYCRKLNTAEKPQKGDLGSLFWPNRGHYHSFVFLDSQYVFSKNSPDPKYKYQVQAFEEMFHSEYQSKARKCWMDYQRSFKKDCDFEVQFHRCKPIETNFFLADTKLVSWDKKIIPLEENVFSWVAGAKSIRLEVFEQTIESLYGILGEVQKDLKREPTSNKNRKFKLEAMEYRLMGLILSDIRIASTSKKLNPIINQIYKMQSEKSPQLAYKL